MGVIIEGLFLDCRKYTNEDGSIAAAVTVAAGRSAYSVFMESTELEVAEVLEVGDKVRIKCRPYVNKNGRLAWSGGVFVGDK